MSAEASPALRRGLGVAVWGLTLAPVLLIGRATTFPRLTPDQRDACFVQASGHRFALVRELTSVVRLVACLAYCCDPGVRARVTAP